MLSQNQSTIILLSIDGLANYYLEDPKVKMKNLRKLIESGTVAQGMNSIFPTATWAIHTSMVTGKYPNKHGVLGNRVVRKDIKQIGEYFGDRMWDKEDVLIGETIYDAAKRLGYKTASICWPVTRGAKSIDFNIPEFYEQDLFEKYSSQPFWNELKDAGFPVDQYGSWSTDHSRGQMQDWLTTEITKYLIQKRQANFIMLHYLLPDSFQHDYGTKSKEVYWALEYIDERIGDLIETLQSEGLWEDSHLFICSDHGFVDTKRTLYPNVLFKLNGLYDSQNPSNSKVLAVSNGGSSYVYLLEKDNIERERLRVVVRNLLNDTDGIRDVYEIDRFAELGLPGLGEHDNQRPDFVLECELDCFVHFEDSGNEVIVNESKIKGMHGYLPSHQQLKAMFIAVGKSFHSNHIIPEMNVVDIAPTIAKLLDVELENADGQVIEALFKEIRMIH
ncbi:alkaline phosphatase family protein [Bacillus sp. Marseille-P3661]|uniref:alkaline phosphatase family protein n=1 Tax=Bacillus sp. Marseille-P3661 TaxID=1936234 RepID=UPI000C81E1FF|nr:ectonucleotide pyrophosphatase/phosphodiesterase [Bacillus sp. Marseille-P3661]